MIEQSTSGDISDAMTIGHSPSFPAYSEDTIRDARALKAPELSGAPSEDDPF